MQERQIIYPSSESLQGPPGALLSHVTDEQREAQEAPATRGQKQDLCWVGWHPTYETASPVLGQQHAVRAGTSELG